MVLCSDVSGTVSWYRPSNSFARWEQSVMVKSLAAVNVNMLHALSVTIIPAAVVNFVTSLSMVSFSYNERSSKVMHLTSPLR